MPNNAGQKFRYLVLSFLLLGTALLSNLPAGASPSGEGTLVGYVYGAITGSPIPGVAVHSGEMTAYSNDDGYYRMAGLPQGPNQVSVLGKTIEVQVTTWTRHDFPLEDQVSPSSDVGGQVVDINTTLPLASVAVTVTVGGKEFSGATDNDGAYLIRRVPHGDALVSMTLDGYKPANKPLLISGPSVANGFLKSTSIMDVEGTVKGSRLGEVRPLKNVSVGLTGFVARPGSGEEVHFFGPEERWTDDNGKFKYEDFPPGRYVIEVVTEGYEYYSKEIVFRRGDAPPAPLDIELTPLSAKLSVTLTSSGYSGAPLKGVTLKLAGQPGSPVDDVSQEKVADEKGAVTWNDVPPGVYHLALQPYPEEGTLFSSPLFDRQERWVILGENADEKVEWDISPRPAEVLARLYTVSVTEANVVAGGAARRAHCVGDSPIVRLDEAVGDYDLVCAPPGLPPVTPPAPREGVTSLGVRQTAASRAPLPEGLKLRILSGQHEEFGAVDKKAINIAGLPAQEGSLSAADPVVVKLDKDGMLSGLMAPASYKLEVEGEDFLGKTFDYEVKPWKQDTVTLVPTNISPVVGRAMHTFGMTAAAWTFHGNSSARALRGAKVTLTAGAKEIASTTANLQGIFVFPKVPAGAYDLKIEHRLAAKTYSVQVTGDGAVNIFSRTVPATKGGSLSLAVSVNEEYQECTESIEGGTFRQNCVYKWRTITIPATAYLIEKEAASFFKLNNLPLTIDLPPGRYQGYLLDTLCGLRSFSIAGSASVEAKATLPWDRQKNAPAKPQCTLETPTVIEYGGFVMDTGGRPVPSASVRAASSQVVTDPDGFYLLEVAYDASATTRNNPEITASAPGYKPVSHKVSPEQYNVDFVLEPTTTLRVKLVEQTDKGERDLGCVGRLAVDGIEVKCDTSARAYMKEVRPGTTVTVRTDLVQRYYPVTPQQVTIPKTEGPQVIDHKVVFEPLPKPLALIVGGGADGLLVSTADGKPLKGRILAGAPHARLIGVQLTTDYRARGSSDPLTHVRWKVRVERGNLRPGFSDPIKAVYLEVLGRECGKEEEPNANKRVEFSGALARTPAPDSSNSGIWGGEFYADQELPCGPLKFFARVVTRDFVTASLISLDWNLWPTAGDFFLRKIIAFFTESPFFVQQMKLSTPDFQKYANRELQRVNSDQKYRGLKRVFVESAGFRVERDPDDIAEKASLRYVVGPAQWSVQFAGSPGFLPRVLRFDDLAPSVGSRLEEMRASGYSGSYNIKINLLEASGTVKRKKWEQEVMPWNSRAVRRTASFNLRVPVAATIRGDLPMEQAPVSGGSTVSKTPYTVKTGVSVGVEPSLQLPLPIEKVVPGPWTPFVVPLVEANGGLWFVLGGSASAKFESEVEPVRFLNPSLGSWIGVLSGLAPSPSGAGAALEAKGKVNASLELGAEAASLLHVRGTLAGQVKDTYDVVPQGYTRTLNLKAREVKGWAEFGIGTLWYERTFRTDDHFFYNWKRGSESEISVASSSSTINWVARATDSTISGTTVKGMSGVGNAATATDSKGRVVMVRTLEGGKAAYPNNMQIQYLLMEPAGKKWSGPKAIGAPSPGPASNVAAVRMSDGRVLAVWSAYTKRLDRPFDSLLDFRTHQLFYAVWDGNKWTQPAQITNEEYASILPSLSADASGNAVLAWVTDRDGYPPTIDDTEIWTAKWTGSGFAAGQAAVLAASVSQAPSVSVSGDTAALAYVRRPSTTSPQGDNASGQALVVVGSAGSWGAPQRLPTPSGNSAALLETGVAPVVAAGPGGVRAYWVDASQQPPQQEEEAEDLVAVYTASLRDGAWSQAAVVSTEKNIQSLTVLPSADGAPSVAWSSPFQDGSVLRAAVIAPDKAPEVLDLAKAPALAGRLDALPGARAGDYVFLYENPSGDGLSDLSLSRLPLVDQDLGPDTLPEADQSVTPTSTPVPSSKKGWGCTRPANGASDGTVDAMWPVLGLMMVVIAARGRRRGQ